MQKIDELDSKLLIELKKDCNISIPLLSKKFGINSSVLYSRINRLVKKKIITKFTIETDDSQLGIGVKALVGINRDPKDKSSIHKLLMDIPNVVSIYEVTGRFDIMIRIFAEDLEQLHSAIIEKIGNINGIINTETFVEPSLISAVISFGVFPSILIPSDWHVPMICFATDFISVAYDDSNFTLATLMIASIEMSLTQSVPDVPEPF